MANPNEQAQWRVIAASVRGANHERAGLPNQDAWQGPGQRLPVLPIVVAVADGHGNAKSFRSDVGARLAVDVARHVLDVFLKGDWRGCSPSTVKRAAEERLPQELVRGWQQLVDDELRRRPFSAEELGGLAAKDGAAARAAVEANPRLAYGSTLVAAAITDDFHLYLQLGDGDVLLVSDSAEVTRPVPGDSRLMANETTSLVSAKAWADFRIAFHPASSGPPALILLSTDGYGNSFRNDAGFLKVGSDLLAIIREEGADAVEADLEAWLTESTRTGSGDDITVVLLCRTDLATGRAPPEPRGDVDGARPAPSETAGMNPLAESADDGSSPSRPEGSDSAVRLPGETLGSSQ